MYLFPALSIAGVCGFFWKSRILQEDEVELAHRPSQHISSVKGRSWLAMVAEDSHVLDMETEVHIGSYFVDGFDAQNMTVYEFHGEQNITRRLKYIIYRQNISNHS